MKNDYFLLFETSEKMTKCKICHSRESGNLQVLEINRFRVKHGMTLTLFSLFLHSF